MSARRLAAVVLNHRTPDETCRAVSSLLASHRPPDHLIVVDNDTADACRIHLASCVASSPPFTYLHTGRNLGFSGGMNVGIRAALDAGAALVLLVNSDIVVSPSCVERLESSLVNTPGCGVVGPLVLSRMDPNHVDSSGIAYNERTGRLRVLGAGKTVADVSPARRAADAVSGSLVLVTREVFEAVGLLDERFFFGFEDVDFCLRARAAGFSTRVTGDAVVYHEGARTIGPASSRRFYFAARNHLLLASRRAADEAGTVRLARLCYVVTLNLVHAVTADAGSLWARLAATARGVRDHLLGRYGADPTAQ